MIKGPRPSLDDIAQVFVAAQMVLLHAIMRGGNPVYDKAAHRQRLAGIKPAWKPRRNPQTLRDKRAIGFGNHQLQTRVGLQEGNERFSVEVIGVIVTGSHHVDKIQSLGRDYALGQARVRLVGERVFLGE